MPPAPTLGGSAMAQASAMPQGGILTSADRKASCLKGPDDPSKPKIKKQVSIDRPQKTVGSRESALGAAALSVAGAVEVQPERNSCRASITSTGSGDRGSSPDRTKTRRKSCTVGNCDSRSLQLSAAGGKTCAHAACRRQRPPGPLKEPSPSPLMEPSPSPRASSHRARVAPSQAPAFL